MARITRIRELYIEYRPHPSGLAREDTPIRTAIDAWTVLRPILECQPVELFVILHLDTRRRLIGIQEIARGGISHADVSIRTILAGAIGVRNSAGIICGHNHPSGDPDPSPEDIQLTRAIQTAAEVFSVDVLDHLIIGSEGRYVSLQETGRMKPK